MILIVLHELGHFTAAKAVGMRVERFSLFFPPLLWKKKVGETEYAVGLIPAGGYVKISGMNPAEDLPDDVRTRAYYSQPVWKRVTVIAAGPAVNLVLGLVLLVVFAVAVGPRDAAQANQIGAIQKGLPAQGVLHAGDRVVAVDGQTGTPDKLRKLVQADKCGQALTKGCKGARPLTVTVERDGTRVTRKITPVYDPSIDPPSMRLGFSYDLSSGPRDPLPLGTGVDWATDRFWFITKQTVQIPPKILDSKQRKQINGIVGSYETPRQTILADPSDVVFILAVISL